MDGTPTHGLVREALDALGCLAHRGAASHVSSDDPGTSDGAGLMVDVHAPFLAAAFGVEPRHDDHPFGLGMVFLPPLRCMESRALIDRAIKAQGLPILGWRELSVARDVLGM